MSGDREVHVSRLCYYSTVSFFLSSSQVLRRHSDSTSLYEEDEYLLDQPSTPGAREDGEEATKSNKEKTIKSVACSLIMLMDRLPGTLEITTKHIYFTCDQQEKKESQSCEFECGQMIIM